MSHTTNISYNLLRAQGCCNLQHIGHILHLKKKVKMDDKQK